MEHSLREYFHIVCVLEFFFFTDIFFNYHKLQKTGINIPAKYDGVAQTVDRNNVNT
jgi:hypothetical protein